MIATKPGSTSCDVLLVGGGFAGAATALLLKRRRPQTEIVIVERDIAAGRNVGEATVEISAWFLHEVLGLYDHLVREHLPKHGLRFWFSDGPQRTLGEMSEVGPHEPPRLPTFQLDRARLDAHLLQLARDAGCRIIQPARVERVAHAWPSSRVTLREAGQDDSEIRARWVLDASGRDGLLARALGIREFAYNHPIAAIWQRWRGVRSLDEMPVGLPSLAARRRLATNHFCGYGFWCWVIPLSSGETSIGLVFDPRHANFLASDNPEAAFTRFCRSQPGLRELLASGQPVEGDLSARRHLCYRSTVYAAPGWALVGDAASFLDPFYSPGLDHGAMSAFATAGMVARELDDKGDAKALEQALADHNGMFARSLPRWLAGLYIDKYELMGDAELMRASYQIDTALYYLAVVGPTIRHPETLRQPIFGLALKRAAIAAYGIALIKRRLVRVARARRLAGTYGRRNHDWRAYGEAFDFGARSWRQLGRGLGFLLRAELEVVRLRIARPGLDLSKPVPEPLSSGALRATDPTPA